MTDLNDWRLVYPGTNLHFGTLATEYPFQVQVDITEVAATNQDMPHPNSDGMVMGVDTLGGFSLIFTMTTIPEYPLSAKPWVPALNRNGAFIKAWRADAIRRSPGEYAYLVNEDRGRRVYGRPRKAGQGTSRMRKGEIRIVAQFDTIDPNWYSETEKLAVITPVPAASGGIKTPLKPPFSSAGSSEEIAPMVNAGDSAAWSILKFHGPGKDPQFNLLDISGDTVWNLRLEGKLKYDEVLTIDTRPWSRGATINGKPAGGRIRGTALDQCLIPVGAFFGRYKVSDKSGNSFADIRWRDTFVSM